MALPNDREREREEKKQQQHRNRKLLDVQMETNDTIVQNKQKEKKKEKNFVCLFFVSLVIKHRTKEAMIDTTRQMTRQTEKKK